MRETRYYPLLLALPGLALAAAGLVHPTGLSYGTAQQWYLVHVPGLLVFPLVGWALAELVTGRRDAVAWVVRLTAYVYATFYTALDVVSGIGAGYVTHELGPGVPRPEAVSLMFRLGTPLGEVGSWALLACVVVLLLDRLRHLRASGLVALVLLPGAGLVHTEHIFSPLGVLGMALLGLGTAALVVVAGRPGVIGHTSDR